MITHSLYLCIAVLLLPSIVLAQSARTRVLEGNKLYGEEKFDAANNKYRDALNDDPLSPIIHYNIGNTYHQKKNYEEALQEYDKSLSSDNVLYQAQSYYNTGNTLFRMGKLLESIEAYKRALELNPDDTDAKYNLEYVRALLKDNAQKQPQEGGDQSESSQQQQQQEGAQGENEEQNKSEEQQGGGEEQPLDPKQISKEDAERLLDALQEDEKDQLKDRKIKSSGKVRVIKDW